jgi:hypothetical protein
MFGGSLGLYGSEEADPVGAARVAGRVWSAWDLCVAWGTVSIGC